jgi:hypothetical protein
MMYRIAGLNLRMRVPPAVSKGAAVFMVGASLVDGGAFFF